MGNDSMGDEDSASAQAEEIARAFKIVDSDGDGKISTSELHLYLFGLGCNLTKKQMNDCPTSCDESTARAKYDEYKPEEVVTEAELQGIFNTWDDKSEGKVSWKQITTPINDGDDICPFPEDVKALFNRIVGDDLKGDEFNYRKFMGLMARTMEMQTGNKAPIEFDSDLFKVQGL